MTSEICSLLYFLAVLSYANLSLHPHFQWSIFYCHHLIGQLIIFSVTFMLSGQCCDNTEQMCIYLPLEVNSIAATNASTFRIPTKDSAIWPVKLKLNCSTTVNTTQWYYRRSQHVEQIYLHRCAQFPCICCSKIMPRPLLAEGKHS